MKFAFFSALLISSLAFAELTPSHQVLLSAGKYVVTFQESQPTCKGEYNMIKGTGVDHNNRYLASFQFGERADCLNECTQECELGKRWGQAYVNLPRRGYVRSEDGRVVKIQRVYFQ